MPIPFRASSLRTIPAPVIAALCMLAMALCYATTANLARIMGDELNALMITFLRNAFGLLLLAPLLLRSGTRALRTTRPALHLLRSACNLGSMLAWFWALPHVVLADAVALMFTGPLFAALGGVLLFGERLGRRRALALATGFAGMLVIIRPDFSTASLALIVIVLSAAGWGAMGLCNKRLTVTDTTEQIVVINLLMVLPVSLLLALLDWQWPSWTMLAIAAVHGSLGTLAHIFLARALALADTAFCMPFDFTRLPFAAAIAYPLFGQLPDLWTVLGAAVIFAAAFSIATRERA